MKKGGKLTIKLAYVVFHPVIRGLFGFTVRPFEFSTWLSRFGIKVHMFSLFDSPAIIDKNLYIHNVFEDISSWLKKEEKYLPKQFNQRVYFNLRKFLAENRVLTDLIWYRRLPINAIGKALSFILMKHIKKYEINVVMGAQHIASSVLAYLKAELDIPTILDIEGLLVEEAIVQNRLLSKSPQRIQEIVRIYRENIRKIDKIIGVSPPHVDLIKRRYNISGNRIELVKNAGPIVPYTREKRKPKIAVYAGLFNDWEDIDFLVESLQYIKRGDIKVVLLGDGPKRQVVVSLLKKIRRYNKGILYLGRVPRTDVFRLLSKCDIGLLPLQPILNKKVALPIKLFDYMSVGLPILTVRGGYYSEFVDRLGVGVVTANNSEAYASELISFMENYQLLNTMSQKAKEEIINHHNWRLRALKLMKIIQDLLI